MLSRQRYLDKLRIVDVDPYPLPNPTWSKSETSFPSSVLPRHCKLFDIYYEFLHNGRHVGVEKPRGLQPVDVWLDQRCSGFCEKWLSRCTSEGMIVLDFCLS